MLLQLAVAPVFIDPADGADRVAAAVDGGFLHVVSGADGTRVDILAEFAELAHEIDLDRARAAHAEAERRIANREDGTAEAELAKAVMRVNLAR